jgi:hypothetical protein
MCLTSTREVYDMSIGNFRLVTKFSENQLAILYVSPHEERVIANVLFPDDKQISDNVQCAEEIANILRKRIRRSV